MIDLRGGQYSGEKREAPRLQQMLYALKELLRTLEVLHQETADDAIGGIGEAVRVPERQGVLFFVRGPVATTGRARHASRYFDGRRADIESEQAGFREHAKGPRAPAAVAGRNLDQCRGLRKFTEKAISVENADLDVVCPKEIGEVDAP